MLTLLHIENIALIEEIDITFHNGFNVLTGETGAGKSIVVDAISAVLGERTSRDLIRTGCKSALVSASFEENLPQNWCEENGFADAEELILQRELHPEGKNTCRVNGKPITVAQLKELGKQLLNIHGQHDGQQLLDPLCHLGYLDRFGKTDGMLADYLAQYQKLLAIHAERASLKLDESEKARRVDSLTFQISELERADLQPEEDVTLEGRKSLLRNTAKLMGAIESATRALYGDEDQT
ncbi:MAG: AAA family ATPase, partial [Eubacteriales bacterium]